MAIQVGQSVTTTLSPNLKLKEYVMKPEVNAVLQEVKAQLANPQPKIDVALGLPDFKVMSIMEATKYCVEHGVTASKDIAFVTGKSLVTVQTALWKMRNPKKVKAQYRRAKKLRDIKAGVVKEGVKATKVAKPKITNGQYEDGMDTPYRDSIQRRGGSFELPQSLAKATRMLAEKAEGETKTTNIHNELMAENRRLKILLDHYESLLFKGGK